MIVSKFKGYTGKNPQDISLDEIVNIIRSDESVKANTLKHRYFLSINLKADADKEKEMADTFSVAARFKGGRKLKHLVEMTGMGFGDFDKVEPDKMQELFLQLKDDPHSVLVFTTHSGRGLRIVFRYQVEGGFEGLDHKKQAECYTAVFHRVMDYFEKLVGLPSDRKCCDCTRISNFVHDPEVYYRPEAEPFVFSLDELAVSLKKPAKPRRVTLALAVQAAHL